MWRPDVNRCAAFLQAFSHYMRLTWFRPREEDRWLADELFFLLKRLPEPTAWYYSIYEGLATALMVWECFSDAERLMRKTYEVVRGYYGEDHQACAYMALRVAAVYHNQMRFSESREWYGLACRLYRKVKPLRADAYVNRAEACEKMAGVLERDGDYTGGHRYVDEAMSAMEEFRRCAETAHPDLWKLRRSEWQYVYLRRARLYFGQGRFDEAQQALDTAYSLFPLDELSRVELNMCQVRLYMVRERWEPALALARRDLETMIRYHGETIKAALSCREQLGDVLAASGQMSGACEQYIRAADRLREKYPFQTDWIRRLQKKAGGLL